MDVEEVARISVDCGLRVHKALGPGMLESAYEAVLAYVLADRGLLVERQRLVPIRFENLIIDDGFRADLIIEGCLLIELKAIDRLAPVHGKQVLTYLRFLKMPVGLLMNFGAATFREGLQRIVNRYDAPESSPLSVNQNSSRTSRSSRETSLPLSHTVVPPKSAPQ